MIGGKMYDTLLFLHVLSAFAMVTALGLFWALYVASGSLMRLVGFTFGLWGAGSVLVIVFGIWLAFDVGGYSLLDGWIIGAIVLWLIAGAFGGQLSTGYRKLAGGAGERPALMMHVLTSLAVFLLLIDMIWKPGA